MYVELSGQRYALDGVLTHNGVGLLFADTPVEDVDRLACALPEVLRVALERQASAMKAERPAVE